MKQSAFFLVLGLLLGMSCGCQSQTQNTNADVSGAMELVVEPGEQWLGKMKTFIFSVSKTPQMAAWIEDETGRYIATITVTGRSAHKKWRGAPKEGRPESLPVWNHKHNNNAAADTIDSVSTATPKGSVKTAFDHTPLIEGNTYTVYLEINHSFDYNDIWTTDNAGVNGQPSLLYQARFTAGQTGEIQLVPIGRGSVDGSNGNITAGLEGFTDALHIVKTAYIKVR